jgi:AcrR family transcriptional regulator
MGEGERDREGTEKTLMDAVGSVIREEGFTKLGINKVAKRAGVSKVLIYRYFGSLDGLIESWLLQQNYWVDTSLRTETQIKALAGEKNFEIVLHNMMMEIFRGQVTQLRSTPEVREMIRWFLCEESPVAAGVMKAVEDRGYSLTRAFIRALEQEDSDPGVADSEAVIALLVSGIYNLALYSDRTNRFNGVALDTDEGWERILGAVETISKSLFTGHKKRKKSGDEQNEERN